MIIRELMHSEIGRLWDIDRSEVIDAVYIVRGGELVLEEEHWELTGWPEGERESWEPTYRASFERGATFWGAFEAERLVGAAVLESRFIGRQADQLQLKFLHVSKAHRGRGIGGKLFGRAADRAREMGAAKLYISATPSENTVRFYLGLGCELASELDPQLYALEPDDIHLQYVLA